MFQFYHDTKPFFGGLDDLLPLRDASAVERAIKISACNIYHGCVHNVLHEQSEEVLKGLYKSAFLVIQAIAYKQTWNYVSRQADLLSVISSEDQQIVNTFLHLRKGGAVELASMSVALFVWSQKWIVCERIE